ncbi:helix-turn-helix domain-containing protein [Tundrisphaera lichenicola]|uniref:helix-turn-helix domain-containing protein n=1 Tax=Tundrisphaera lichenicola TaxID=2029860 RepID=UPI003EB89047
MNDVERLHQDLAGRFRGRKVELDPSETETGPWFLSVDRDGALPPVVVEWRPEFGFGLSTPGPDDFGTGVDESYPNARATFDRVVQLVLSGSPSVPPVAVRLAQLRQAAGLTQAALADRLGIKQANVSKVENRDDLHLSTVARFVEGMGARLSVRAIFPDGRALELDLPGERAGTCAAAIENHEMEI